MFDKCIRTSINGNEVFLQQHSWRSPWLGWCTQWWLLLMAWSFLW